MCVVCVCMCVTTTKEKEVMNFRETKECIGGVG